MLPMRQGWPGVAIKTHQPCVHVSTCSLQVDRLKTKLTENIISLTLQPAVKQEDKRFDSLPAKFSHNEAF